MSTCSFLFLLPPLQPDGIDSYLDHVKTPQLISWPCLLLQLLQAEWPSYRANWSMSSFCLNLSTEHRIQTPTQFLSYSLSEASLPLTYWAYSSHRGLVSRNHPSAFISKFQSSLFPVPGEASSLHMVASFSSFKYKSESNSLEKASQATLSA